MSGFIFMTRETLSDMRANGTATGIIETRMSNTVPKFARAGDDYIITVPDRFMSRGEVSNIASAEMVAWIERFFMQQGFPLPGNFSPKGTSQDQDN